MSAFFLYSQANRTRVKEENGEASFGDIVSSSALGSDSTSALLLFCCYIGVFYHVLEVGCWVSIVNPIYEVFSLRVFEHLCLCAPPRCTTR